MNTITEEYTGFSGEKVTFEYHDADSFADLDYSLCRQVYAVCFCGDEIVIVHHGDTKLWGLVGGTVEKGETLEQTLKREIREESNMEVLACMPVGCQKVIESNGNFYYQLRYVCTARPHGPFVSDPAGSVSQIKLIDPSVYKEYFDWGKIGERIISRAVELVPRLR